MRRLSTLLCGLALALGAAAPAAAEVVDDNLAVTVRGGTLVVFARGEDGTLHMRNGVDAPWASLGVKVSSGPSATTLADGSILVFARAMDERVTYATVRDGSVSSWQALDGTVASAPAAGLRRGTDTVDLFVRSDTGRLLHRTRTAGAWSSSSALDAVIVGAPATASRKSNFVDAYVRGTDDNLYANWYDQGTWNGPLSIEKTITAAPSVSALPGSESMNVFVRDQNRALSQRTFHAERSGFGPWTQVDPRPITSAPASVAGAGGVHVLARDGDDVLLKTNDGDWKPWRSLGTVAPPAPPPPPPPSPVQGGTVELTSGLACTPRRGALRVSVNVRRRAGRAKPRVQKVVFYYRKGKGKVARSDRKAPYRRAIPVDLEPGTHRVFARIHYKRPGKRKLGVKTVSKRFAVCR